jgi:hypothetical protein
MPHSVLKISKSNPQLIEVLGEFPDETAAAEFADKCQAESGAGDYEFAVEAPEPKGEVKLPPRPAVFKALPSSLSGYMDSYAMGPAPFERPPRTHRKPHLF